MESCFLFLAILRRAEAELLCETQNEMLETVEARLETNLCHGQSRVREQQGRVLQAHLAQKMIRAMRSELFEQAAEMKHAHLAASRDFRQRQIFLKIRKHEAFGEIHTFALPLREFV